MVSTPNLEIAHIEQSQRMREPTRESEINDFVDRLDGLVTGQVHHLVLADHVVSESMVDLREVSCPGCAEHQVIHDNNEIVICSDCSSLMVAGEDNVLRFVDSRDVSPETLVGIARLYREVVGATR